MELRLPPFVLAEREALREEIYTAFADVHRYEGVSWNESVVLDLYGSEKDQAKARASDPERQWQDVASDPEWRPDMGVGGWSFLDAIGFRYYLPAGMVRSIDLNFDAGIEFHLTLPDGDLREWRLEKWSLFNLPQRRCIKRFLFYMEVVSGLYQPVGWSEALEYWEQVPDDEQSAGPASIRKDKRS